MKLADQVLPLEKKPKVLEVTLDTHLTFTQHCNNIAVKVQQCIATAEQTLLRKTRTILAQLRTGHSRILGQYLNRIDPTVCNHCHNCGHSPHDAHHLFDCPSKPTTLTVESLWTAPTETAKHRNLSIDETS